MTKINRICLVVAYYGKFNNFFQLWLDSCRKNEDIDFLVFTDDEYPYNYPSNVKVKYTTLRYISELVKSKFDFEIKLDNAYKLCDYKVAYGIIFEEYLKEYEFWGYCDVDLIFGRISSFITDDILNSYDKILSRGHFTLFRNNEYINNLFRNDEYQYYKKVFSCSDNYSFDEWAPNGINDIFIRNNIPIYDDIVFSDLYYARYGFYPYQRMHEERKKLNNIYTWEDGKLTRYYLEDNELNFEEVMYIHFQKRSMNNSVTKRANKILIIPNQFIDYPNDINKEIILRLGRDKKIYLTYYKVRVKSLIRKIKRNLR